MLVDEDREIPSIGACGLRFDRPRDLSAPGDSLDPSDASRSSVTSEGEGLFQAEQKNTPEAQVRHGVFSSLPAKEQNRVVLTLPSNTTDANGSDWRRRQSLMQAKTSPRSPRDN